MARKDLHQPRCRCVGKYCQLSPSFTGPKRRDPEVANHMAGVAGLFSAFCQARIRWSLRRCVSIRETHLAQSSRYSNALNATLSSLLGSLVVNRRFARMRWSRGSSFRELTAEQGLSLSRHCRLCWNAPPTQPCPYIYSFVSINFQETSMNVNGCNFFRMEQFNDTSASYAVPHQTPFCQTAPLLLSIARQQNLQDLGVKVQPLLPHHQHQSLTSWTSIIK
jgi:hypothetical protein